MFLIIINYSITENLALWVYKIHYLYANEDIKYIYSDGYLNGNNYST